MTILDSGTLVIAIAAAVGTIYSIWRNGHSRSESLTAFKTEIKAEIAGVKKALEDDDHGLSALGKKLNEYQLSQTEHCAKTSTSLKERVIALEDEANDRKPRKRKT